MTWFQTFLIITHIYCAMEMEDMGRKVMIAVMGICAALAFIYNA